MSILAGKVAVITGGGRGLGLAIAGSIREGLRALLRRPATEIPFAVKSVTPHR